MAQIRLTKAMREDILRKIMNDLPQVDYMNQVTDMCRKDVQQQLPMEIKNIIGTRHEIHLSEGQTRIILPNHYSTLRICVRGALYGADVTEETRKAANDLVIKHNAQRETYNKLEQEVETTLAAYTTVAKLREACPQFDKYLPNEAAINHPMTVTTSPIPALQAAGWPKGKP